MPISVTLLTRNTGTVTTTTKNRMSRSNRRMSRHVSFRFLVMKKQIIGSAITLIALFLTASPRFGTCFVICPPRQASKPFSKQDSIHHRPEHSLFLSFRQAGTTTLQSRTSKGNVGTNRPLFVRSLLVRQTTTNGDKSNEIDGTDILFDNTEPNQDEECPIMDDTSAKTLEFYTRDDSIMISEVLVAEVESLRDRFTSFEGDDDRSTSSTSQHSTFTSSRIQFERTKKPLRFGENVSTHVANIEYNQLVEERELVLVDILRQPQESKSSSCTSVSRAFHRAGPRKYLHFDPSQVNAAIVVCGGLCPGLNNVVRELTHALYYLYGVRSVYGIVGGFHGFHDFERYPPIHLTNELVADIHHEGGTVLLPSARGGFDIDKILSFVRDKEISQLYVIGGDGTHRGAYAIHQACRNANLNIAVAGIPKTIDNDVDYIDRSFGFMSAVEASQQAIRSGTIEAKCNVPNGIGIIKLMGRSAGFLAAFAALGSGDVDLVLIPEVPIVLDGENGILPFLRQRIKEQKYAVIVVAEGAGEELLGRSEQVDAGGNRARPKIGEYIKDQISEYFTKHGEEATIKYIDPSYMVRSVPANGADALYCMQIAQNAVHGAMAGYTGFSTGSVNRHMVYIPIPLMVASSPRSLDPYRTTWERIIAMTGQPNTAPPRTTKPNTRPEKSTDSSTTGKSSAIQEFPKLSEPMAT